MKELSAHTPENIIQKEELLRGLEHKGFEAKVYSHETVMNVMEEYAAQFKAQPEEDKKYSLNDLQNVWDGESR